MTPLRLCLREQPHTHTARKDMRVAVSQHHHLHRSRKHIRYGPEPVADPRDRKPGAPTACESAGQEWAASPTAPWCGAGLAREGSTAKRIKEKRVGDCGEAEEKGEDRLYPNPVPSQSPGSGSWRGVSVLLQSGSGRCCLVSTETDPGL